MSPMRKTIQVAHDRAFDETKTVLPAEVARGIYIENPPSAQALKLMHLLIAVAGGRMADDVQHHIRLSAIRSVEGMRNHDRASLRGLFIQLRSATMVYDDVDAQSEIIGGFMDEIRIDYRDEISDDLLVKWWFGRTFRQMAAESNHWAILDRQTIFALSSKYAILLFQHIASLVNLDHVTSKEFSVSELRAILGVENSKLNRFADMNRRALQPAIAEINQLSRLTLTATPRKVGRTIAAVSISWEAKPDPRDVKRELNRPKVGRSARRAGKAETPITAFPSTGSISYGAWGKLARQHLPRPARDVDVVAVEFRAFCEKRHIPLDGQKIEEIFVTFCTRQKPAI